MLFVVLLTATIMLEFTVNIMHNDFLLLIISLLIKIEMYAMRRLQWAMKLLSYRDSHENGYYYFLSLVSPSSPSELVFCVQRWWYRRVHRRRRLVESKQRDVPQLRRDHVVMTPNKIVRTNKLARGTMLFHF